MIKDLISFFQDLYKNRRLILKFAVNDLKLKYAGSVLGIFWAFINPLITIAVYWFVFTKGLKAGMTNGQVPFIIYLVTGIIAWFYFADCVLSATNCFREYSYLVQKVVFNIRVLPTVKLISNVFPHLFFIIIALILTSVYGYYPSLYTFQVIYYLFCLMVFITGFTWITASIQPFFSDIKELIAVMLQVLMWGTPVLWQVSAFPEKLQTVLKLNPLFYVVQGYRDSFLGTAWFWEHGKMTIYFWCFTLVLLLIGSTVYTKMRPHFSDVL